jgi:hypothetical protein
MFCPPLLLLLRQSLEEAVHGAIEALALPVPSRMVGSCARLGDIINSAQLVNDIGLKAPALVRVDSLRDPVV